MNRLPVRFTLVFVCVVVLGAAAFLIWSSDRTSRLDSASMRRFDALARTAGAGIADLRGAQQSYVSVGQGEDFWFVKVNAIRKDLEDRLAALKSIATAPEAAIALDDTAGLLQDFAQMDQRAREYTRSRQLTLASDMIFGDGFELTRKAGDALERAVGAEQTARDAARASLRARQLLVLAGAAGVAVLGLIILLPVRRAQERTPAGMVAPAARRVIPNERLVELDDLPPPPARPEPAAPDVDLPGMASLCGDLARVTDTKALPEMLARAAAILEASGIIVWIADPDGRELAPILVHGYSPNLAMRLGTIARGAENVTASAYRTTLLQTVKGDAISSGAIAVPLVAPSGCVGVMAAEVKNGGEQREKVLAAATIIAAQLATLVGPPTSRAKSEATG